MELENVSTEIIQGTQDTPQVMVAREIESKKILVPVDFSENSRRTVDYVGAVVADTNVEVTLFNAWRKLRTRPGDREMEEFLEQMEKNIQLKLDRYRERLEKAGVNPEKISTKYTKRGHSRAGEILKEAEKGGYDTIVMGRRGSSEVHECRLGRVADVVSNRAEGFAIWLVP